MIVTTTSQAPPGYESTSRQTIIAGVAAGIGGLALGLLVAALIIVFYRRPPPKEPKESEIQISNPIITKIRTSLPPPPRPFSPRARSQPVPIVRAPATGNGDPPGSQEGESTSTATFQTDERTPSETRGNGSGGTLYGRWSGRTRNSHVVNPDDLGGGYHGPRRIATLDFRSVKP